MTEYVAGFLFSHDRSAVALIRKLRPAWQRGKLNGIGGHVEPDEAPIQAMRREFGEKTGVCVENWHHFATLSGKDWRVHFYRAFDDEVVLQNTTDEKVGWFSVSELPRHIMPNLSWLIPMALSVDEDKASSFKVAAQYD